MILKAVHIAERSTLGEVAFIALFATKVLISLT